MWNNKALPTPLMQLQLMLLKQLTLAHAAHAASAHAGTGGLHHLAQPAGLDAEFLCESGRLLRRSETTKGWPAGCPYVLVNQTFNWPSAAMPRVAVPSQLDSTGAATAAHTLKYVSLCEQFIAHAFASVWARVCPAEPTAKHRTVFVDSGANEGTWSLLAAAYGCHSLAVEPQSTCIGWITDAAQHNRIADSVETRLAFLGRRREPARIEQGACSVRFQGKQHGGQSAQHSSLVPTMPLSAMLQPSDIVPLWHIDVEGAEVGVLLSSRDLLVARRVQRVMVELTPENWRSFGHDEADAFPKLAALFGGWHCVVACSGRPFLWTDRPKGPCRDSWRLCRQAKGCRANRRSSGGCLQAAHDVYCVAPEQAHDDPGLKVLTGH